MASSRKKQDEKNLKTLRELGSLPQNKYCFDCNQRGPTYVNVTIGSFVCTKCSGMLRGLTPPHRVKSISMATFTTEEVDLLKSRGNEYCRRVWLGLYEGTPPTHSGDEQAVRDFLAEKYEKRRYYLDPSSSTNIKREIPPASKPPTENNIITTSRPMRINGNSTTTNTMLVPPNSHRTRPEVKNNVEFVADFDKADIFTSSMNNNTNNNGFANFDNNPVFDSSNVSEHNSSSGMPTPAAFNNINKVWNNQQHQPQQNLMKGPQAPTVDRYAALKDLDNALKSQSALDWSSSGSNGSLYSSPTPTGSVYSSSSPQSSMFGSPTQGQFMNAFPATQENGNGFHSNGNGISNPFNNGGGWGLNNGSPIQMGQQNQQQPFANPFRDPVKTNGFSQNFQSVAFPISTMPINGANSAWTPNPFKVGATAGMNSNNPFL